MSHETRQVRITEHIWPPDAEKFGIKPGDVLPLVRISEQGIRWAKAPRGEIGLRPHECDEIQP